jgi:DNA-binding transcriptional regulator YiaG
LCERFGISLRWLAMGTLPVKFDFGVSMECGDLINKNSVFSWVFDKYLDAQTAAIERDLIQKLGEANFRSGQFDEKIVVDLVKVGRAPAMAAANYVRKIITLWMNWLPEDLRLSYINALLRANADFHSEYKEEIKRALPPDERKGPRAVEQFSETPLTLKAKTLTTDDVKPVLPKLIERLNRATEERGSKVALAKWLGVHRQSVTDWLSGKQEPGGEITLKMLHWVEQQERQK